MDLFVGVVEEVGKKQFGLEAPAANLLGSFVAANTSFVLWACLSVFLNDETRCMWTERFVRISSSMLLGIKGTIIWVVVQGDGDLLRVAKLTILGNSMIRLLGVLMAQAIAILLGLFTAAGASMRISFIFAISASYSFEAALEFVLEVLLVCNDNGDCFFSQEGLESFQAKKHLIIVSLFLHAFTLLQACFLTLQVGKFGTVHFFYSSTLAS